MFLANEIMDLCFYQCSLVFIQSRMLPLPPPLLPLRNRTIERRCTREKTEKGHDIRTARSPRGMFFTSERKNANQFQFHISFNLVSVFSSHALRLVVCFCFIVCVSVCVFFSGNTYPFTHNFHFDSNSFVNLSLQWKRFRILQQCRNMQCTRNVYLWERKLCSPLPTISFNFYESHLKVLSHFRSMIDECATKNAAFPFPTWKISFIQCKNTANIPIPNGHFTGSPFCFLSVRIESKNC